MKRLGFTLTEILCVIGIIALLAAISFPAFLKARRGTGDLVCTSNLRQLYMSIELYRQDHETAWNASAPTMGFPDIHHVMRLARDLFGDHACKAAPWGPFHENYPYVYYGRDDFFFGAPGDVQFGIYYSTVGDNGVLLADFNHNERDIPWMNEHTVIKAKTMTIGGSYRTYRSQGNFFILPGPFWEEYSR